MPLAPSPAQRAASRANGAASRGPATAAGKARAAGNGTRHGLRGGDFALLPSEDADELASLRHAIAADWRPRAAYERHWAGELVAALWRQQRLRGLELAALEAASQESPPLEASLRRLLGFARYGARIDGDMGRALTALRSLKGRTAADLADRATCTPEPEPTDTAPTPVATTAATACTPEPERPAAGGTPTRPAAPKPLNRHERRRREAMARESRRQAA